MSKAMGLFYRTTTGKSDSVAEKIRDEFGGDIITLHEFGSIENDDFAQYECLIIACPTCKISELQSEWEGFFPELDDIDFSGQKVAYLGNDMLILLDLAISFFELTAEALLSQRKVIVHKKGIISNNYKIF
jgi:flavodoxin